eukprot:1488119-Amphidinium_carterae.1
MARMVRWHGHVMACPSNTKGASPQQGTVGVPDKRVAPRTLTLAHRETELDPNSFTRGAIVVASTTALSAV